MKGSGSKCGRSMKVLELVRKEHEGARASVKGA